MSRGFIIKKTTQETDNESNDYCDCEQDNENFFSESYREEKHNRNGKKYEKSSYRRNTNGKKKYYKKETEELSDKGTEEEERETEERSTSKYEKQRLSYEKRTDYVPLNVRAHLLVDYFSNNNKELFFNEISSNTILTFSNDNYPFSGVYLGRINIKNFYEKFYSYVIADKSYQGETYASFGGSKMVVTKDLNQIINGKEIMTKYWFVFTFEMVFNNHPGEKPYVELLRVDIHMETPIVELYKDVAKLITSEDVTVYEDSYKHPDVEN
jgi:hypothetical protein